MWQQRVSPIEVKPGFRPKCRIFQSRIIGLAKIVLEKDRHVRIWPVYDVIAPKDDLFVVFEGKFATEPASRKTTDWTFGFYYLSDGEQFYRVRKQSASGGLEPLYVDLYLAKPGSPLYELFEVERFLMCKQLRQFLLGDVEVRSWQSWRKRTNNSRVKTS